MTVIKNTLRTLLTVGAMLASTISTNASAELIATPLRGDARLVEFRYDEDNTFLVLTRPREVTHVQMAQDEEIKGVFAGDTASFEIAPTKDFHHIFIKPKYDDTRTSMTVLTSKRAYQIILESTGENKKWYQRVSWIYDTPALLDLTSAASVPAPSAMRESLAERATANNAARGDGLKVDPKKVKDDYVITGDAPFKPAAVFSDDRFTYVRLADTTAELPALFEVGADGGYALVNYTVDGNLMKIQRVVDHVVMRLGKEEVRIDRATAAKTSSYWSARSSSSRSGEF